MITIEPRFYIKRLGVVMRPDLTQPEEVEGVLNPGATRGPDGTLYLFPRLVGRNNYSRIGIARVIFDDHGDPAGVERLGIALEPQEPFELRGSAGLGGVEDPRVTFVEALGLYVMTYVAWGRPGPRVALAVSENCLKWERVGLAVFQADPQADYGVSFNDYDNKDAAFAPDPMLFDDGMVALGMLHRPVYNATNAPRGVSPVPGIWVSCCDLDAAKRNIRALRVMMRHAIVAQPKESWEAQRIGLGTPPLLTKLGYMTVYHGVGVNENVPRVTGRPNSITYEAGVLIVRQVEDRLFSYRTAKPILIPEMPEETHGVVNNVVFPTGIDKRSESVYDIYYGMGDRYIGVARLSIPERIAYERSELPELARLKRANA